MPVQNRLVFVSNFTIVHFELFKINIQIFQKHDQKYMLSYVIIAEYAFTVCERVRTIALLANGHMYPPRASASCNSYHPCQVFK